MEREGAGGAGAGAAGGAGGDENVIGALAAGEEAAAAGEGAEEVKAEAAAFFAAAAEEEEAAESLSASRNMAPRSLSGAAAEARTDEEGGQEGRPRFGPRAVADPLIAQRHGGAVVVGICLFDFEFVAGEFGESCPKSQRKRPFLAPLGQELYRESPARGREARS